VGRREDVAAARRGALDVGQVERGRVPGPPAERGRSVGLDAAHLAAHAGRQELQHIPRAHLARDRDAGQNGAVAGLREHALDRHAEDAVGGARDDGSGHG
jgi:hypothetical protein